MLYIIFQLSSRSCMCFMVSLWTNHSAGAQSLHVTHAAALLNGASSPIWTHWLYINWSPSLHHASPPLPSHRYSPPYQQRERSFKNVSKVTSAACPDVSSIALRIMSKRIIIALKPRMIGPPSRPLLGTFSPTADPLSLPPRWPPGCSSDINTHTLRTRDFQLLLFCLEFFSLRPFRVYSLFSFRSLLRSAPKWGFPKTEPLPLGLPPLL